MVDHANRQWGSRCQRATVDSRGRRRAQKIRVSHGPRPPRTSAPGQRDAAHQRSVARRIRRDRRERRMIYRECGGLKTTYEAAMALHPLPIARWPARGIAVLLFPLVPLALSQYYL